MIFFPAQAVYTVEVGTALRGGGLRIKGVVGFMNFARFRPLGSL